ncbi:MAG: helix-turn-helix domain-containing protein [Clostridia bacterium]|nr:helix-turn-helix domain-containing protein [Clostridia bacterium]
MKKANQTNYDEASMGKSLLDDEIYPKKKIQLPVGTLVRAAEITLIRGSETTEYVQKANEITYVVSGKATFYCNDVPTEIRSGDVHYIKKGLRFRSIASPDENFHCVCIAFIPKRNYDPIAQYLQFMADVDTTVAVDNGKIKRLCDLLIDEMYMHDDQQNTMLNLYITQILITFFRIINGNTLPRRVNKASSSFTVYHLMRYIDNKYMSIQDIKSVADELSYSEYYLSHLFKEKIGISIKDYITRKKLSAAAEMLAASTMSVSDVANKIGYASAHTFRQAFKRHFGVSPSEYSENMNGKN